MNRQQKEITALYCRLSQGDKNEGESNSIINQKAYLTEYVKKHRFPNPQFYVDDGNTGSDYDRPDFKRMCEDIDNGLIKTVIVKDLSRFGREHINMEWLYEIKWPEMGAPPFGYRKNPDDPKRWLIDEDAAPIVRRIFQMAMEGFGCSAIATALWEDKVLTPSAYKQSKGIGVGKKSENPYYWEPSAFGAILDNSAYVGATEGLKSLRVSFRSKKRVPSPKEHRVFVENTHEPIIDRLVWEKVQTLRQNKRRLAKTGATSIFSGLLYCADCGSKMNLCVSNGYHFFRCGGYKRNSRTKECTIHYIRESVLEQLVLKQLQHFLFYMRQFERAFVKRQIDSSIADKEYELYQKQKQLEKCEKRAKEIDRYLRKTYEDNVCGKITDEQYFKLTEGYEAEQAEIAKETERLTAEINETDTAVSNVEKLIAVTRSYTRIDKLTPEILNAFIDRIEIHEKVKTDGKKSQQIDIYYSYVGIINIPTEEEMEAYANKRKQISA